MKPCLFVIDTQQKFLQEEEARKSLETVASYIPYLVDAFRKNNFPVVYIYHKNEKTGLVPGSEGYEMISPIDPSKADKKIYKTYGNAFVKTDLGEYLKSQDIDMIFLTGYCAEHCVLSTYQGARDNDFTPVMVKEFLASYNQEHIRFVEEICDIITYDVLTKIIE